MKNIIFGIIVLFISSYSFGQLDRSKVPSPGPAPEINIADPIVFDLDNGMKVILSSNHKIPKVSFNLVMGSDPRIEGEKAGLSEVMGSLLLSGTQNKTKDELDNEKDFIGASLYAGSSYIFLNVLTKHLDKGLDLMTDVMKNASFPESEFNRIVKQFESQLFSLKTDPNGMASNAVDKTIFTTEHPYGEIMTEESLSGITREDVIQLYKDQFTPAGSYLVIVGDITKDKAKEIVTKYFDSWDGGVPFTKDYSTGKLPKENKVYFVNKPGAVQSIIDIAFPVDMTPGDEDQIKLSILNNIFGGHSFGARLFQNLREDKAYTYGAYSKLSVDRKGSFISASGSFRNDVTDSSIVQFLYELNRITEELVTEEELALTKASMSGSFARSLESPRTIADFALNIYRNNLPSDYYQTYLQRLEKVTREDVIEVAKKYFKPNNLNIIVVGNKEEVYDNLKQFGEIEELDAFGDPLEEIAYATSELTTEQIIHNYLMAITKTSNWADAEKKIDQINTLKQEIGIKINQSPMEMTMVMNYKSPNMSNEKLEFNGMVVNEEIFDGNKGVRKTMNQFGGIESKELTEEEVKTKRKTAAVFSEFSMICCHKEDLKLLGLVEKKDGNSVYVIEHYEGDTKVTAEYNSKTFLKETSERFEVTEEGPQSMTTNYSDYIEYDGYLFPSKLTQMVESVVMYGTVKSVEINGKMDVKIFKVE